MRARLGTVGGEMDLPAARLDLRLVALEIEVEMRQRMVLDVARLLAQRLEFGQAIACQETLGNEAARHVFERPLQFGVLERPRRILLELAAARLHQAGSPLPMAGASVSPASTSAT